MIKANIFTDAIAYINSYQPNCMSETQIWLMMQILWFTCRCYGSKKLEWARSITGFDDFAALENSN